MGLVSRQFFFLRQPEKTFVPLPATAAADRERHTRAAFRRNKSMRNRRERSLSTFCHLSRLLLRFLEIELLRARGPGAESRLPKFFERKKQHLTERPEHYWSITRHLLGGSTGQAARGAGLRRGRRGRV